MPTIANFTNDHSFPTFAACPIENDASSGFFQDIGPWINPTRHWAAFFEVTASDVPLELKAIDKSGQQVKVFYTLSVAKAFRTTFPVGHTLAVLYPARSQFMTGTEWLGLGDELRVMIIPLSMVELLALNERVQQQSSVVDGKYACHGCGARKLKKELYVCFRCELAWYCDEDCQLKGWNEKGHKEDCKVLRELVGMYKLEWNGDDRIRLFRFRWD